MKSYSVIDKLFVLTVIHHFMKTICVCAEFMFINLYNPAFISPNLTCILMSFDYLIHIDNLI